MDYEVDYFDAVFLLDGKQFVFIVNLCELGDVGKLRDVYLMNLVDGDFKQIMLYSGFFGFCVFLLDGFYIVLLGYENEFCNVILVKVWLYDVKNEWLFCLIDMLDVYLSDVFIVDLFIGGVMFWLVWINDGQGFYVFGSEQGSIGIYYILIDGFVYLI